jgi:hypothetical protein
MFAETKKRGHGLPRKKARNSRRDWLQSGGRGESLHTEEDEEDEAFDLGCRTVDRLDRSGDKIP